MTGTTIWHNNADEPDLIDYDMSFKSKEQDGFYVPDAYRASDHDPVVIGLYIPFFLQPVKDAPAINTVKASSTIPIKFSLHGDMGLDIFADGSPASVKVDCATGSPIAGTSEPTKLAGKGTLNYNPLTDIYNYPWQTNKKWAGTCRQLDVTLADGTTVHSALFQFK